MFRYAATFVIAMVIFMAVTIGLFRFYQDEIIRTVSVNVVDHVKSTVKEELRREAKAELEELKKQIKADIKKEGLDLMPFGKQKTEKAK